MKILTLVIAWTWVGLGLLTMFEILPMPDSAFNAGFPQLALGLTLFLYADYIT